MTSKEGAAYATRAEKELGHAGNSGLAFLHVGSHRSRRPSRTETVTYDLISTEDIFAVPLAVLPASGLFAATGGADARLAGGTSFSTAIDLHGPAEGLRRMPAYSPHYVR